VRVPSAGVPTLPDCPLKEVSMSDQHPRLPDPCQCDAPTLDGDHCVKCGRWVIAAPANRSEAADHDRGWPKRTVCTRCGARVLKARGERQGRPSTLDVEETEDRGGPDQVYLGPDGIARPAEHTHRRRHDAVHPAVKD
jgi:hypothetical protein